MDETKTKTITTITHTLIQSPLFSLPIRVPGIVLSVKCSKPHFQITLKGSNDDSAIFENNQSLHNWKINPLNYAMGRIAYDIVWEEGLTDTTPIEVQITYSCVCDDISLRLATKQLTLEFTPSHWARLPRPRACIQGIKVTTGNNQKSKSPTPIREYRLALGTIPFKIIQTTSSGGVLKFSDFSQTEKQLLTIDLKLDFSHIFGAWLVFEDRVNWNMVNNKETQETQHTQETYNTDHTQHTQETKDNQIIVTYIIDGL
jgi:hypothetical protein